MVEIDQHLHGGQGRAAGEMQQDDQSQAKNGKYSCGAERRQPVPETQERAGDQGQGARPAGQAMFDGRQQWRNFQRGIGEPGQTLRHGVIEGLGRRRWARTGIHIGSTDPTPLAGQGKQSLAQHGPATKGAGFDGSHGDVQYLGGLGLIDLFHVNKQQRPADILRQLTQGGNNVLVGKMLQQLAGMVPRRPGDGTIDRIDRRIIETDSAYASGGSTHPVDPQVAQDSHHPGTHISSLLEAVDGLEGSDQSLLGQIVSLRGIVYQTPRDAQNRLGLRYDKVIETPGRVRHIHAFLTLNTADTI